MSAPTTTRDSVAGLQPQASVRYRGIAVGKVLREVESTLVELDTHPADPMDELAARRSRDRKIS